MTINYFDKLLMKKICEIENWNVTTICYENDDICLKRHKIKICNYYFI